MVERIQLSKVRSCAWYSEWKGLSLSTVLENDREFERRAHQAQGFPLPVRKPLSECLVQTRSDSHSTRPVATNGKAQQVQPLSLSTVGDELILRRLGCNHPYVVEKRKIRRAVKDWHRTFVQVKTREPTESEWVEGLGTLFQRAKQLDRLITAAVGQSA